jgi:hypothetical protein
LKLYGIVKGKGYRLSFYLFNPPIAHVSLCDHTVKGRVKAIFANISYMTTGILVIGHGDISKGTVWSDTQDARTCMLALIVRVAVVDNGTREAVKPCLCINFTTK